MKSAWVILVASLFLAVTNPALAERDTLRCGSQIVKIGMTMDEILQACGEPNTRKIEEIPVRSGNRVTGTTEIQTWVFERPGGKPASLVFDQESLVSIKYE